MTVRRIEKFGSEILRDAQGWQCAVGMLEPIRAASGAVVVSTPRAPRGLLDLALQAAERGDCARALDLAARLVEDHHRRAAGLGFEAAGGEAEALLKRLAELVQGAALVGHASPRTRDAAHALLGSLTASLFTDLLVARGFGARRALELPSARGDHGRARPDEGSMGPEAPSDAELLVLPGGFGQDPEGSVLAFGPGGSDLSAVALAAAWGLPEVRIWTSDDGILSADPSLVPKARALPSLSYAEARALSAFGARALHPDVLALAASAKLELVVANLRRPGRGTRITGEVPFRPEGSIVSVAYKEGLHLLRLPPSDSLEILARTDAALREAGAQRFGAIAGPDGTLLAVRADSAAAIQSLAAFADWGAEVSSGWALVALVGEGLRATTGSALRLLAPFQLEQVGGLLAGSSPISVSFLVPEDRLPDLIPRLHRLWIEEAALVSAVHAGFP